MACAFMLVCFYVICVCINCPLMFIRLFSFEQSVFHIERIFFRNFTKGREEQIDSLFLDIYFPAEMFYSLCTCCMYKSTAVSLSETSSWQLSIINMQTLVEVKIIINYLSPP